MPAVPRRKSSDCRTSSSSSITWTSTLDDIAEILLGHRAQREAKDGPTAGVWLDHDLAAVRFDDGARDRQADPHSLGLGRDERLKQLRTDLRRDAGTGIRDRDRD